MFLNNHCSPSQETSQLIQNFPESISRLTEDTSSNLSLTKNNGERNYSSPNWIFLKEVKNNAELETLRCINGVARNRTLIHGIRYACTKTRNKRRFCKFMLLCKFLDSQLRDEGPMHIYYRGEHCHRANIVMPMKKNNINSQNKKKKENL
uniref:FLYWCH-type domain-containing protein n=2 Tax=Meloidogyne TaxID=189290 RepID=A0A915M900_MELJA